jgi:hypothetical protein
VAFATAIFLGSLLCDGRLVTVASAAENTQQGARSKVRVRCGALLDNHGAKVFGRGASSAGPDAETQRCNPSEDAPAPVKEAPVAIDAPPASPRASKPARPVTRPHPAAPAVSPVERVQVSPEWESGEHRRLARFAPSPVQRLSTVLVSGGVLWFLQTSFWASLLLLGLPLWRHVDLLAIVARTSHDEPADSLVPPTPEDERVAGVLDDDQRQPSR